MTGPLRGVRVLDLSHGGPGTFAAMLLADMGADVLRIERAVMDEFRAGYQRMANVLTRGMRVLGVDLKHPDGVAAVLTMAGSADVLVEGFRPGVMERFGLGPDDCLDRNPRLVYARLTGWGQDGPLAGGAGHDINYAALSGALGTVGLDPEGPPAIPPTLLADFAGGGLTCAFGILCALLERAVSGEGQVVDAAMTEGASQLTTILHSMRALGFMSDRRGTNQLDGGLPHYNTYETSDGRWVSVGALEPPFFAELVARLGLEIDPADQADPSAWPEMRRTFADVFRTKTRDEWCELLEGTDACFAPVLELLEAPGHRQHLSRHAFVEVDGIVQPAPAPRFSRTPPGTPRPAAPAGDLSDWGLTSDDLAALRSAGAVR